MVIPPDSFYCTPVCTEELSFLSPSNSFEELLFLQVPVYMSFSGTLFFWTHSTRLPGELADPSLRLHGSYDPGKLGFPVSIAHVLACLSGPHTPWGQGLFLTHFVFLESNLEGGFLERNKSEKPKTYYLLSSLMEFWHRAAA